MTEFYARFGKRSIDLTLSSVALILLSPLMVVTAVIIYATLGLPILYIQIRPGRGGRAFKIWKFRTMTDLRGSDGKHLPDEMRLTALGRFLRATSLDELPELFNVVIGDMSLVGPRPLLLEYLERYSARQARRHEVRPGITGWAQVNGRNAISWEQKFEFDVWYVDQFSFWLDCKILAKTVWQVLHREGISAPGSATMPNFQGSPEESRPVPKPNE